MAAGWKERISLANELKTKKNHSIVKWLSNLFIYLFIYQFLRALSARLSLFKVDFVTHPVVTWKRYSNETKKTLQLELEWLKGYFFTELFKEQCYLKNHICLSVQQIYVRICHWVRFRDDDNLCDSFFAVQHRGIHYTVYKVYEDNVEVKKTWADSFAKERTKYDVDGSILINFHL